jgi:hypothetical protein
VVRRPSGVRVRVRVRTSFSTRVGASRSAGDHLISYTCKDGNYRVQYWAFQLHRRLRRLADISMFSTVRIGNPSTGAPPPCVTERANQPHALTLTLTLRPGAHAGQFEGERTRLGDAGLIGERGDQADDSLVLKVCEPVGGDFLGALLCSPPRRLHSCRLLAPPLSLRNSSSLNPSIVPSLCFRCSNLSSRDGCARGVR